MKKTSRLFTLAMAGLLAVSVAGCSSKSSKSSSGEKQQEMETRKVEKSDAADEGKQEDKQAEKAEQAEQAEQADQAEQEQKKADVAVKIDKAELGEDYSGDPVVIFTMTFTNEASDKAENYLTSCHAEVYQDGVECDLAFVTGLEGESSTNVKKGKSTTFQQAYKIKDKSPVEIEVKELFSWDDTVLASGKFELE